MMAIDGTWRRPCTMEDVSETGARLTFDGSIEGLPLKEFFLLLSTVGKAYRRCQLAWVNGNHVASISSDRAKRRKNPKRACAYFAPPKMGANGAAANVDHLKSCANVPPVRYGAKTIPVAGWDLRATDNRWRRSPEQVG